MGTDHDRARARSRLAAPTPVTAGRDRPDTADDRGDGGSDWAPGWLGEDDDADRSDWAPDSSRWRAARWSPGRGGVVVLVVVGLVAVVVAALTVWRDRPTAQAVPPLPAVEVRPADEADAGTEGAVGTPAETSPPAAAEELVVSVVGLVDRAGLVRLAPGSRVADALAAAGGPRPGADVLGLNMAERVDDGDQILVGAVAPDGGPTTVGSARVGSGAAAVGSAGVPADANSKAGKVNLNAAGEADLDALPGVGPVTAAAIVAWRQSNGKFTDVEQLGEVDGIGPARLAKLRELVTV
ncbi:ComEA family DNA-binding protein [Rhodococcus sp. SGAir0479]|uniref:ComEA family DNA-binding protein n=1 Tax=Rhodococcus sp. SGAir0479 TaxID=2567884 RepID=UPI0010CD0E57|nr:ComEA family DNA-binding protein [Rhodococcus sp. SGAir0479]QCQ91653.1 ComEA family DNA-binding protein [Rhodococcus sp. SGAir0479]